MNYRRIIVVAIFMLVISAVPASPALAQVSIPYTTDLIIDNRDGITDVGDVTLNGYGMLNFEIDTVNTGWRLEEIRVWVGDEPPQKLKQGDYTYVIEALNGEDSYSLYLDLSAADLDGDSIVYITACAELTSRTDSASTSKKHRDITETALVQGETSAGKGKNLISYFSMAVSG